jgi:hypothetical protein
MLPTIFGFAFAILADYPDAVQRHVQQIGEYIKGTAAELSAWIAHNHEFVIALSAFVTAVFTAVLAIATIRLWNSTAIVAKFAAEQSRDMKDSIAVAQASARAAELSARATVGVELPIVFVNRMDMIAGQSPKVLPSLPPIPSAVWVWFRNYGRTPAILHHLFLNWDVTSRLPDEPDYDRLYPLEGVIEPGDTFEFRPEQYDVIFTQAQIDAASKGSERFWVYGYLSYADFLRNEHRIGFCAVWTSVKDGPFHLMQAGTDKYIYQN